LIKPICRCSTKIKRKKQIVKTSFLGSHSLCEPPDPIPNSEVKPQRADDSVRPPHAKVGFNDAVLRNLVTSRKQAVTEPSPMLKARDEKDDGREGRDERRAAAGHDDDEGHDDGNDETGVDDRDV
jgi:hypothetical protein